MGATGNKNVCDLVVACLTSLGTNYCLDREIIAGKLRAGLLAQAVLFVEAMHGRMTEYAATGEMTMNEDVYYLNYLSKVRDIWQDIDCEIITFFHGRNDCSSVKEKYHQVKTQPKMKICQHCSLPRNRSELKLCTRCKIAPNYNAECRRSDWPDHKVRCKQYRSRGMSP